jgi:hypothetical protein
MANDLPPFLLRTDPMEVDDLPLQVSLLTMEVASLRRSLEAVADLMEQAAANVRPPQMRKD